MKKQRVSKQKRIPFLDYASNIGEVVRWNDIVGDVHEGKLIQWLDDHVAVIELHDKTTINVQC
jgi:vacuolar-type H+-ATPase catalytic subunit A/Vma1